MKIKLRTFYAGPLGSIQAGEVVDMPDAEAVGLVRAGFAVSLEAPVVERAEQPLKTVERAEVSASENPKRKS